MVMSELQRIDEYRNVPQISFGFGALKNLSDFADKLSKNKKIMLVTDENIEKIGIIKEPYNALVDSSFSVDVYTAHAKEPDIGMVKTYIDAVRKNKYGLVVGIGGGSVMDLAKIVGVMQENPGEIEEYVCPNNKQLIGSVPKILVPTTSGTGSECSNTAVVIIAQSHEYIDAMKTWITGDAVLADAAIVDPTLTIQLPPEKTACSGMDALSHVAESVLSLQANPFSDAIALKAIELISKNLKRAYSNGEDKEARWNMSLSASIGGMVISYPWIAGPALLGHVASEGISAKLSISHGMACGVLLPYVYWYNFQNDYAVLKLSKIAEAMGVDTSGINAKESAKQAILRTFDLLEDVGLTTDLSQFAIGEKEIRSISNYILQRSEEMYSMSLYNPKKATLQNIIEFFEKTLEGRKSIEKTLK